MLELTIKGTVYQFNFDMGFMREMNKRVVAKGDSSTNATKNVGLQFMIGGVMDNDVETLVDVLLAYAPRCIGLAKALYSALAVVPVLACPFIGVADDYALVATENFGIN